MAEKKKVKWEVRTYDQSGTIVLNNPAEVRFINVSQIIGNIVTINQDYTLQCTRDFISGVATFPNELILKTNQDEEDTTQYTIQGTNNEFILKVICKYYEQ